ncbi:MAG TPA: glucose-1-phosphate cytidylyltransferase [Opitutaceae bacterium]|nr:glucose-1-phosphate cytidylyltransferase [Opitutaceae bacterium]
MKVVILCGGKGTRLREETEFRPKPMVPIGHRPIVWHIMKTYAHHGHTDFILCLGYKGEMIRDYFRNYLWNTSDVTLRLGHADDVKFHDVSQEADWTVTLAETGEEAPTAERIKRIQRYITPAEPFLLTYGDGVATVDINASIAAHRAAKKVCTITAVHPAGRFGALRIEDDSHIHTFNEKPQFEEAYVNGGYMVCEHRFFDYLTHDRPVMLEQEPMQRLAREGQLNAFKHEGFWQPMDTYQEAQHLNTLWNEGRAPWKVWR